MLKKNFNHNSVSGLCHEKLCLMIPKGVYPYVYLISWEKLENKKLPPTNAFYRELDMKDKSDKLE